MGADAKQIAVLGSTGSVGRQTLDVVRALADRFHVVGLGAGKNARLLSRQVEEFHPRFVYLQDTDRLEKEVTQSLFSACEFLPQEEIFLSQ